MDIDKAVDIHSTTYTTSYSIEKKVALRVEQGEYVITDIANPIGTYNVHQCAVIYIRDTQKELHGLAHIDGHTEIESVAVFLEKFFQSDESKFYLSKIFFNYPKVSIIGALSNEMKIGLNDPDFNFAKTKWLLDYKKIEYTRVPDKLTDFIVDETGGFIKGFPVGIDNRCTILHTVQQLKRKDAYMGTYPIIKGCDANNIPVYLDERALLKLREYKQNIQQAQEKVSIGIELPDGGMNELLTIGFEYISSLKNEAIKKIEKCAENDARHNQKDYKVELQAINIPLIIPEDIRCTQNKDLLNAIISNINWVEDALIMNLENSNGAVQQAIKIARKYDLSLTNNCLLEKLKENHSFGINDLKYKRYDADITVRDFNNGLEKCASFLYPLIILTSYEESSFKIFELTNKKVLSSIKLLNDNNSSIKLLKCILKQENEKYQYELKNLDIKEFYKKFDIIVSTILNNEINSFLSPKNYKLIKYYSSTCVNYHDCVEKFHLVMDKECEKNNSCHIGSKLLEKIQEKLEQIVSLSIKAKIHNEENSQFSLIRKVYLGSFAQIHQKEMLKFDEYTISKILAFPEYQISALPKNCPSIDCKIPDFMEDCQEICNICVSDGHHNKEDL